MPADHSDAIFPITYRFRLEDGAEKTFRVELERASCALRQPVRASYPEWTRLDYRQCGHCPLRSETHPHCPVAVGLIDVVAFFRDVRSVEKAEVSVETEERVTHRGLTPIYPALSSLVGIHMVTSGCPVMDKLRPMARFHLPFATAEETVYRALSMYALAQLLRRRRGLPVEEDFSGLARIYQDVNRVNGDFSRRLTSEALGEATANAITNLDCFAQMIDFSISEAMFEDIESVFAGYLGDG